ncbi:MAG: hypothetical protein WAV76_03865, partial [Bacteroidota bacterium]
QHHILTHDEYIFAMLAKISRGRANNREVLPSLDFQTQPQINQPSLRQNLNDHPDDVVQPMNRLDFYLRVQ